MHYKSDFIIPIDFSTINFDGEFQAVGVPDCDFAVLVSVGEPRPFSSVYRARRRNGEYENCRVEDDILHVILNDHKLPCGQLWLTLELRLPNDNFADGYQSVVACFPTEVVLTRDTSDAAAPGSVGAMLPVVDLTAATEAAVAATDAAAAVTAAAETAAETAETSATAAQNAAEAAETSAEAAQDAAQETQRHAESTATDCGNAKTYRDEAATYAADAQQYNAEAKAYRDEAQEARDAAMATASQGGAAYAAVSRLSRDLGQYPQGAAVALTVAQSGKAVNVYGEVVAKSGYAVSEQIQMRKGFIYLFRAEGGVAEDVALCARYVTEDTVVLIEYTYEYVDGEAIRATADYDTTLVYERDEDGYWVRGDEAYATLPQTRIAERGSYIPLFKSLSADAPESGYFAVLANDDMMAVWSAPTEALTEVIPVSYGFLRSIVNQKEDKAVVKALQERVAELEDEAEAREWERLDYYRSLYGDSDANVMVVKMRAGSPPIQGKQASPTRDTWLTIEGARGLNMPTGWQRDDILEVAYAPPFDNRGWMFKGYLSGMPSVKVIRCADGMMATTANVNPMMYNTSLEEVYCANMFASVSGSLNLFGFCSRLKKIHGLDTIDVSRVTDISDCFRGCQSLVSIPGLETWTPYAAENMYRTFRDCSSLTDISNIRDWQTPALKTMFMCFYNCSSLTELTLNWTTPRLETLVYAFAYCSNLESINIPNIDTRCVAVGATNYLINGDFKLRRINVGRNFFLTTAVLPFSVSSRLGFAEDNVTSNGWLEAFAATAPTIRLADGWNQAAWDADKVEENEATPHLLTEEDGRWHINDGRARTIQLNSAIKNAAWAQPYIALLQEKGYTIA